MGLRLPLRGKTEGLPAEGRGKGKAGAAAAPAGIIPGTNGMGRLPAWLLGRQRSLHRLGENLGQG